ncbi:hypothetical protein [Sphingomonas sp. J315]|uniref:hypothetical protein n=1 Tax=Sphingomonas sp. J315 TaxID=2898433 RepID=UPI00289CAA2F|nr:hypothetical protein [Sphingomonas sp. J315]
MIGLRRRGEVVAVRAGFDRPGVGEDQRVDGCTGVEEDQRAGGVAIAEGDDAGELGHFTSEGGGGFTNILRGGFEAVVFAG